MTGALQRTPTLTSYMVSLIARELASVVGADHVSTSLQSLQDAAFDWSWMSQYLRYKDLPLPAADIVCRPASAEEVAAVVRIASAHRVPVVPRGGGSGTQGGTFALYGGIALDLTRMNRIVDIDETSLVLTAEAGIDGAALEAELNALGLTLPHYPGSLFSGATLGGYLAARGSGVVSTKYGKAADLALQVEAVLPPGRVVSTLPVPAHASGPDLMQMLIGSEGTFGVITQAVMRLEKLPEHRAFLSFRFDDVLAGLEAGRRIMTARWHPAAMRLYDQADTAHLARILDTDFDGAMLLVMCDGDPQLVTVESAAIAKLCIDAGGTDLGRGPCEHWWENKYEPFREGKAPAPPMIFGTTDSVCRFADMPRLYAAKRAVVLEQFADLGATYTAHFSHWFPWGVMVYDRFYVDNAPDDPAEAMALHDRLWDAAMAASLANGGVVNEHHGIGVKLGRFLREAYGDGFSLLADIRTACDPDGIMNPGKLGFGPPR